MKWFRILIITWSPKAESSVHILPSVKHQSFLWLTHCALCHLLIHTTDHYYNEILCSGRAVFPGLGNPALKTYTDVSRGIKCLWSSIILIQRHMGPSLADSHKCYCSSVVCWIWGFVAAEYPYWPLSTTESAYSGHACIRTGLFAPNVNVLIYPSTQKNAFGQDAYTTSPPVFVQRDYLFVTHIGHISIMKANWQ